MLVFALRSWHRSYSFVFTTMAIDYFLKFAGPIEFEDVAAVLTADCEMLPAVARNRLGFSSGGGNCFLLLESKFGSELNQEHFGFQLKVCLSFRANKFAVESTACLILICVNLLSALPNDCVLLFNGDTPIFLRRGGALWISDQAPFWISRLGSALADAAIDFSIAQLPKP